MLPAIASRKHRFPASSLPQQPLPPGFSPSFLLLLCSVAPPHRGLRTSTSLFLRSEMSSQRLRASRATSPTATPSSRTSCKTRWDKVKQRKAARA
eukprot:766182-Hanusia_phi.AAC.3